MDEDAPAVNLDAQVEDEIVPERTNLMEQINMSQNQATARVVGIIKKLPKTYGGSILTPDMMLEATKRKLLAFQTAYGITEEDIRLHYRVFVPYNSQLP